MNRLKAFLLIVPLLLLVTGVFIVPQSLQLIKSEPDYTSLLNTLTWLASGGGAVTLALTLGKLAEAKWPWWQSLDTLLKNFITLVVGVGFSAGATLLLNYTNWVPILQPWYQIVAAVAITLFGGGLYLYGRNQGVIEPNSRG